MVIKTMPLEKRLGIPADFQYEALTSKNFFRSNWHKNKLFVLKYLLKFTSQMVILDLGVGSGNFETFFSNKVLKIVAVDYSDEVISYLKMRFETENIINVSLVQADLRDLSALEGKERFDIVLMVDVLEHIRIDEAEEVVKSLKGLLKPDGKVAVITPNYGGVWRITGRVLDIVASRYKMEEEQHLSNFNRRSLKEVFLKSGFSVQTVSSFNLFSFLPPWRPLSEFLCRPELSLPFCWGNLLVGVFSYSNP